MRALQSAQGHVTIPGVQYGQGGAFAVVFWVWSDAAADDGPTSTGGGGGGRGLDYAYSHVNALDRNFAFDPNEVGGTAARREGAVPPLCKPP